MKKYIFLIIIILLINSTLSAQDLKGNIIVSMDGFRSDNGDLYIALFKNKDGFPAKSEKSYQRFKIKIENSNAKFIFKDISYGTYAVSIFHDENSNSKLDSNMFYIPKEGFGASNNPVSRFGPPSFNDAKFELKSNELNINIKAQYF